LFALLWGYVIFCGWAGQSAAIASLTATLAGCNGLSGMYTHA
jgi:hypothetical protein